MFVDNNPIARASGLTHYAIHYSLFKVESENCNSTLAIQRTRKGNRRELNLFTASLSKFPSAESKPDVDNGEKPVHGTR